MTSKILSAWDREFPRSLQQRHEWLLQRRTFLSGLLKASAVVPLLPVSGLLNGCDNGTQQTTFIEQQPWKTFAVVQLHLFPDDGDGPSAKDINAAHYLKFVLESPDIDPEERDFIYKGTNWLDGVANEQDGESFLKLSYEQQEKVLEKIVTSRAGENWLSYLILYILEALLTAPAYGSNPNGIGWNWLSHNPGFPLPPLNKRYPDLL